MRILIIGSTSVVGRAVGAHFYRQGAYIAYAGRRDGEINFDLTQPVMPQVTQLFDVVIHAAADFGGATDADWIRAEQVNGAGTLTACALAQRVHAKHFILLSSVFAAYQPGDPYFGIYSLSKRHGEEAAQFFCAQRSLPLTVLRPSQIYDDAGLCRPHQGFFYLLADQAQAGKDINLYGTYDATRNYLHINDVKEIIFRIVEKRPLGVFHAGYPTQVRISEMAHSAQAAFDSDGEVRFLAEKPNLSDLAEIPDDGLYDLLGYWPSIDIAEGYRRVRRHRESQV